MSADTPEAASDNSKPAKTEDVKQVYLVSYPKVVFMYPTFLLALFSAFYMQFIAGNEPGAGSVIGVVFLVVFTLNLVVISFDFPRTTSLTLVFFTVAVVLGLYLMFVNFPDMLPAITNILTSIKPIANSTFYFLFATILGVMFVIVKITVQFDYWEVRPNELLHHHGILSDLERLSAPNLRIDKEINDLFEFLLLRSGRLILHPSSERKAIVLENVFFIGAKESKITRMLGALQVQVRDD